MERGEWLKVMRSRTEAVYNRFAGRYWDTWGVDAPDAHREFLRKFLRRMPPGGSILSAACGAGRFDGSLLLFPDLPPGAVDLRPRESALAAGAAVRRVRPPCRQRRGRRAADRTERIRKTGFPGPGGDGGSRRRGKERYA